MINTIQGWLEQCSEKDRPAALAALGVAVARGSVHFLEVLADHPYYDMELNWRLGNREENHDYLSRAFSASHAARLWWRIVNETWWKRRLVPTLIVEFDSWRDAGLDPFSLSQVLAVTGMASPLIVTQERRLESASSLRPIILNGMADLEHYLSQRQDHSSHHLIVAAAPRYVHPLLDAPLDVPLISIINASVEGILRKISAFPNEYGSHHFHADIICHQLQVLPPVHLASPEYAYGYREANQHWNREAHYLFYREFHPYGTPYFEAKNRRASEFMTSLFVGSMDRRSESGSPRYDSYPDARASVEYFRAERDQVRFSLGTDGVMPRVEASPSRVRRWLNGRVRSNLGRVAPENTCFRQGFACLVDVWIGLSPPVGQRDAPSFPDDRLPWDEDVHDLRVVLTEPRLLRAPIEVPFRLPATGASERVTLPLPKMEGERFEGRILVCHGNRILQTAKLTGAIRNESPSFIAFADCSPEDAIRFEIEAVLDGELRNLEVRPGFDAAILVNDASDGSSQATVLTDGSATIFSYDDKIKNTLRTIQMRLDSLVEEDFTERLAESQPGLWLLLAHQGDALLRDVVKDQMAGISAAHRLQIVSARPDALLPLEFVYDAEHLPQKGSGLCPDAESAFDGACCATCTPDKLKQGFCPLRLWGFSKIIERHVYDSGSRPKQGDFRVETASPDGRKKFPPVNAAILGVYEGINAVPAGVKALEMLRTTPPTLYSVTNWNEWKTVLKAEKPQVLILLSHTYLDEDTRTAGLTIGEAEELVLGDINDDYVAVDERTPLVLLLGCSTSNPNQSGQEFHAQFRRRGATIVVGTLAKTYGPLAADAAREFLTLLTDPNRPTTLGEMMVEIRRRLLLKGSLMALALVAYGDADWIMREEA